MNTGDEVEVESLKQQIRSLRQTLEQRYDMVPALKRSAKGRNMRAVIGENGPAIAAIKQQLQDDTLPADARQGLEQELMALDPTHFYTRRVASGMAQLRGLLDSGQLDIPMGEDAVKAGLDP